MKEIQNKIYDSVININKIATIAIGRECVNQNHHSKLEEFV